MSEKSAIYLASAVDTLGAAAFAFGLSSGVGALASGHAPGLLALSALVAGPALRAGASAFQARVGERLGHRLAAEWRARVLPHLLAGPMPRPPAPGEIASLGTDHIAAIRAHGATFLPARLGSVAGPVLVLGLVAPVSWVAAAILAASLVLFIVGMIVAGTAAARASERQLSALAGLSTIFVDRLAHLPLIRHFGAQDRLTRQVASATGEVARRTLAVLRIAFLSSAVLDCVGALSVALVAVYCGFGLLGKLPFHAPEVLSLTSAFYVLTMAPEFYLPMRRLAAAYHEKQLGEAAMRALSEAVPKAAPAAAEANAPGDAGWNGLAVEGLAVIWPGATIGPVSFTLGDSGLIALTGPTGAGKSTLLGAIGGLVPPSAGTVRDSAGQPIARALIATAAQQPLLLPGTLADNIALARPDASRADILAVAERVGLQAVIAARAGGLDMPIDHRGSGLSGGERRRIGIARALLSGRPLLLLDEPTADLDAASARDIAALIAAIARQQPVIAATHDPDLVALATLEVTL